VYPLLRKLEDIKKAKKDWPSWVSNPGPPANTPIVNNRMLSRCDNHYTTRPTCWRSGRYLTLLVNQWRCVTACGKWIRPLQSLCIIKAALLSLRVFNKFRAKYYLSTYGIQYDVSRTRIFLMFLKSQLEPERFVGHQQWKMVLTAVPRSTRCRYRFESHSPKMVHIPAY
jgi:hypothetical protein